MAAAIERIEGEGWQTESGAEMASCSFVEAPIGRLLVLRPQDRSA
jgi:hypothetical protein